MTSPPVTGYFTTTGTTGAPQPPAKGSGAAGAGTRSAPRRTVTGQLLEVEVLSLQQAHLDDVQHVHREHRSGRSPGKTSNDRLSVATAATPRPWNQDTVCSDGPAVLTA